MAMLTPQDITDKRFEKVLIGGYDMPAVDDFLETLSTEYNALYKENAILKGKLKVLVEKVEEYRSTEDAMRMALLTAQRMGEEITVEATRTKEEMLKSADEEVRAKLADIEKRVAAEETRLAAASKETAKFLELSHAIIRKHTEFLKKLEAANQAIPPQSSPPQNAQNAGPAPTPKQAPAKPAAKPAPQRPAAQAAQNAQSANNALGQKQPPPKQAAPAPRPPAREASPPPQPTPSPAAAKASAKKAPELDFEFDDVVSEIGNAVEEIALETTNGSAHPGSSQQGDVPQTLFDNGSDTKEIPMMDSSQSDVTPRPKFDFDDLKFGANFDSDD